jgi:Hemolysins and related proteins containing CBS domains
MEIAIIIALILLNGVFAMSEIALISARKSSLSNDIRHGSSTARIALKLANDPDKFLSTIQIGITLIGILTGIYSGDVLATDFGNILTDAGVPATYAYLLAQTLIVILVTYLTIIFGELVPKRIGMSASTRAAKLLARPMYWLSVIASPFVWILAKSTSLIFNLLHINTAEEKVTEEEIKSMIDEGTENGEVQEVEQDIVDRVFSLGDRSINTIMTYRSDIVSIDIDMNNKQLYDIVCQHLYQVYPVTQGNTLDNIIGVVYLKDLFGKLNSCEFNLRDVIRPAQYFHENMDVYKVLEQIRQHNIKYGLICDEFGSLQGIITMKDILEALVGTLPSDSEDPDIVPRKDGSWLIDGQCSFYDFLSHFEMEDLYPDYNYNTLSGLILQQLGHIPKTGESMEWNDFTLEIVDMDGARIDKVLVTLTHKTKRTINMLQRDYIMRLLQQFFEALEKLVEERDKKDGPELQLQLQSIYRAYFNHPSTFYYDQDAEYILNEMGQNYGGEELLTRIDMLSELLYQDALLKESEEQKYLLRKSLFLLNYLDTHSDTFSFERRGKIGEIEKKIGD